MAISTANIKTEYPLPAYNYRVTILPGSFQGLPGGTDLAAAAGAVTVISCSEVTGLGMEVETTIYKHGFSFATGFHLMPGQPKEVNITIKKGVTANSAYFSKWLKLVYPFIIPSPVGWVRKRDMLIDLCDEKGEPVVRWVVIKAMPFKLEAPTFDANTNEVAFETMEFVAHMLKVEYLTGG